MKAKSNKKSLCLCIIAMAVCLLPHQGTGQVKRKRILTEADYSLWSNFTLKGISDDGNWTSYSVSHPDADTLFVHHLNGKRKYAYANGSDGTFAGNYFVCKGKDSTIHFLKPDKGLQRTFTGATAYAASKHYFVVQEFKGGKGNLCLYTDQGQLLHTFYNTAAFSFNAPKNLLAFAEQIEGGQRLHYASAAHPAKRIFIAEAKNASYGRLAWDEQGNSLYAIENRGGVLSMLSHDTALKQSYSLGINNIMLKNGEVLLDKSFTIAEDGKRLFVSTKKKETSSEEEPFVQVWNAADKALYPKAAKINHWKNTPHLGMWEPASGSFVKVTDSELPWGGPIGKGLYSLTYNPLAYEPQEKALADRDVFLTDLLHGKRQMLLKQQSGSDFELAGSPDGSYIVYFKGKDWHAYSIEKDTHLNLTKGKNFSPVVSSMPGDTPSYGFGGWSVGDKSVLLYDEFDIWKFSADGDQIERLTKGRENGIIFRLIPYNKIQKERVENRTMTMGSYDINGTLLLSARASDYSRNGYFVWERGKGTKELVYTAKNTKNILKAEGKDTYAWTEEDYNTPIQLASKQNQSKPKTVYGSNAQQSQFLQGKMEVVQYHSPIGTLLSGLLYYPADFIKGKKYPMIVSLYEVQSKNRFTYVNPTLCNSNGFNISNLTAKGYFVFLPDTVFETPATGDCALRCVKAAVAEVLKLGYVDAKRMGLIGHSFGGFETDYIITKSSLFACAVAGAAITNLVSASHAVAPGVNQPNFFKIENAQTRMRGSLFENKASYLNNSPVLLADGVNTPLLSWTGLKDPQVLATQTVEFYMALRRLGKEHVMLVYPNEGHDIHGKIEDADLTTKIESWFDYYLKGRPVQDWMKAH